MNNLDKVIMRYGVPPYAVDKKVIDEIIRGDGIKCIITEKNPSKDLTEIDNILVETTWTHIGYDEKYFRTPLNGKVYVPRRGYTLGIPCNESFGLMKVGIEDVPQEDKDYYLYTEIEYVEEKTIGDIYRNAWKYQYNFYTNTFVRLPEKGALQQLHKILVAKEIFKISGSPYDRLADYGRIILFILSKLNLTETEQKVFNSYLQHVPSLENLNDVIYRENYIQDIVDDYKKIGETNDKS
ncbi:MAG: hypothetical protein RR203_02550 [Synergistaceae bacterium]